MTSAAPICADQTADVLIIGGGPVGGALTCALASHGVSTLCVDGDDPTSVVDENRDGRSSAIAQSCKEMLNVIGVWAHIEQDIQPIFHIRVTNNDSPLHLHYDHRDVGKPMGYMARNHVIRRGLFERIAQLDDATLLAPCRVVEVTRDPHWVYAHLGDGRTIRAKLVIGADGPRSLVRQAVGIPLRQGPAYHQMGLVLTVEHQRHHCGVAYERFLSSGPFAILPLPGGHRSSLVWIEETSAAQSILALPDDQFHAIMMERFGDFLGETRIVSARFAYPLTSQHAQRYTDHRVALVGDAAHVMHPVAGQGMNFGLRDVAALVEQCVNARRLGRDVGDADILAAYQRWRRFDNLSMLAITDGVVRLFSNANRSLSVGRSLGLAVVNRSPLLKRFFMRHAMGEIGATPKLMRGEPV